MRPRLLALGLMAAAAACARHPASDTTPAPEGAPAPNIEIHPRSVPPWSPMDPPPHVVTGAPSQPAQAQPAPSEPAPSRPAPAQPAPAQAAPPQAAPSEPAASTLFARLGGMDAIRGVVDTLMARVVVDGRINAFFRGVDLEQLKGRLAEQICQATGGPCTYSGRTMREAHRGLGLTDAHFAALVGDLGYAMNRFGVAMREQDELVRILGTLKPEIVGQ